MLISQYLFLILCFLRAICLLACLLSCLISLRSPGVTTQSARAILFLCLICRCSLASCLVSALVNSPFRTPCVILFCCRAGLPACAKPCEQIVIINAINENNLSVFIRCFLLLMLMRGSTIKQWKGLICVSE